MVAAGLDVTVVEARDRIGGRIWTVHEPDVSVPIELGAEFVHGGAPPVERIARDSALGIVDIAGERRTSVRGRLRDRDDFWPRIERVLGQLKEHGTFDRSFADALGDMRSLDRTDRRVALQYIAGFEAADPAIISERSLAAARAGAHDDADAERTGRVLGGYDGIVRALAASVAPHIQLDRVVTNVRWRSGEVMVHTESSAGGARSELCARAVVITVPLGVLLTPPGAKGHIAFDPPLAAKDRLMQTLAMGAAIRVALVLDEPFWLTRQFAKRHGSAQFGSMAFLLAPSGAPFPAWWTPYPIRAPLLIAWCGGPNAWALSREPRDAVINTAVGSMATLFGMTSRVAARHIRSAFTHDWSNDPYSRGAYSYARVGGATAVPALARPISNTIYIAGEHAYGHGRNGTVDGAIASGERAAELLLRSR